MENTFPPALVERINSRKVEGVSAEVVKLGGVRMADDKFFNYALASKLGVAIPPTVLLPHNRHPEGTTDKSMRNLMFPLNWEEIFEYVGFPAFLKPYSGGGWKNV